MTTTTPTREQIISQIHLFTAILTEFYRNDYARNTPILTAPKFVMQVGPKYCRIVKLENGERYGSVYCFIDMANGDIRKAAGFKAPAAGKRGSIFNENCDVGYGKPADMHGAGLYKR
jgi:hypothetical protein